MKQPFDIDNYGVGKPNIILVYNWPSLNKIGNVRCFTKELSLMPKDYRVAIFKIKWK